MSKQRSPELAIRTVIVSTEAAARMHMRQGNPRLAAESAARGIAMLDDVRSQLPPEARDGAEQAYEDGRGRLQRLVDEAEAGRPSARG